MCRDGFRAPCQHEGCPKEVTCRDFPRLCPDHDVWLYDYEDDEPTPDKHSSGEEQE